MCFDMYMYVFVCPYSQIYLYINQYLHKLYNCSVFNKSERTGENPNSGSLKLVSVNFVLFGMGFMILSLLTCLLIISPLRLSPHALHRKEEFLAQLGDLLLK